MAILVTRKTQKPPNNICWVANIITRRSKVFSFFFVKSQKVVMNLMNKSHLTRVNSQFSLFSSLSKLYVLNSPIYEQ